MTKQKQKWEGMKFVPGRNIFKQERGKGIELDGFSSLPCWCHHYDEIQTMESSLG